MKKLTIFKLEPEHIKFLEQVYVDSFGLHANTVGFNISEDDVAILLKIKLSNKELKEGIYYNEEKQNTWKQLPNNLKF